VTRLRDRRLVVRADASTEGGTGHLMRALALAQAWRDDGGRATWLVAQAPEALLARITAEGISLVRVDAPSGGEADAGALRRALLADAPAVGVLDGVGFDERYLTSLDGVGGRVLFIDDMAAFTTYPVGLVLNQNVHARRSAYPAPASSRFLLGSRYVLLRREFRPEPPARELPEQARRLLVTFGGADPTGMTSRTLRALRRLPARLRRDLAVRVIIGAANADADSIRELVAADADLDTTVLVAVADMPAQMAWSDLAITSGGSTVWEVARMGCPALVVETTPSEVLLMSGLLSVGLFAPLGPAAAVDEAKMARRIADSIADAAWRAKMSALGMRLVDGQGAHRVVQALRRLA
jgi:UDP-2,4-diacetamido-2,4,6-trideoxy-beta-L-altropyranose hydrolase